MRALFFVAALFLADLGAAEAQPRSAKFTCTAEASGGGLQARTQRLLDRRGDLRDGTTTVELPLAGGAGSLRASWRVQDGLPQVARGRYLFRLPAVANAEWQLASQGKPVRAPDGLLALSGEQFRAALASGTPLQLTLRTRDRQEQGSRTIDAAGFAVALDLARQADARALAKAADYRAACTSGT